MKPFHTIFVWILFQRLNCQPITDVDWIQNQRGNNIDGNYTSSACRECWNGEYNEEMVRLVARAEGGGDTATIGEERPEDVPRPGKKETDITDKAPPAKEEKKEKVTTPAPKSGEKEKVKVFSSYNKEDEDKDGAPKKDSDSDKEKVGTQTRKEEKEKEEKEKEEKPKKDTDKKVISLADDVDNKSEVVVQEKKDGNGEKELLTEAPPRKKGDIDVAVLSHTLMSEESTSTSAPGPSKENTTATQSKNSGEVVSKAEDVVIPQESGLNKEEDNAAVTAVAHPEDKKEQSTASSVTKDVENEDKEVTGVWNAKTTFQIRKEDMVRTSLESNFSESTTPVTSEEKTTETTSNKLNDTSKELVTQAKKELKSMLKSSNVAFYESFRAVTSSSTTFVNLVFPFRGARLGLGRSKASNTNLHKAITTLGYRPSVNRAAENISRPMESPSSTHRQFVSQSSPM